MFKWIRKIFKKKPENGQLGCLPYIIDNRDYIKTITSTYKSSDNFSINESAIGGILDQGQTNSCTGHAATYFMNILLNKLFKQTSVNYNLNPFFNYYFSRQESNIIGDNGAYIRCTLKALFKFGVWSCDMSNVIQEPPKDYYDISEKNVVFKLFNYERIYQFEQTIISDLKYILSYEQLPLFLNVKIINSNIDSWTGEMKIVDNSNYSGWHAMVAIGYKVVNNETWFKVANSWGKSWGDKGFAWIHEDYFKDTNLISEIWTANKKYF